MSDKVRHNKDGSERTTPIQIAILAFVICLIYSVVMISLAGALMVELSLGERSGGPGIAFKSVLLTVCVIGYGLLVAHDAYSNMVKSDKLYDAENKTDGQSE